MRVRDGHRLTLSQRDGDASSDTATLLRQLS
jgi:hypothetical protein